MYYDSIALQLVNCGMHVVYDGRLSFIGVSESQLQYYEKHGLFTLSSFVIENTPDGVIYTRMKPLSVWLDATRVFLHTIVDYPESHRLQGDAHVDLSVNYTISGRPRKRTVRLREVFPVQKVKR